MQHNGLVSPDPVVLRADDTRRATLEQKQSRRGKSGLPGYHPQQPVHIQHRLIFTRPLIDGDRHAAPGLGGGLVHGADSQQFTRCSLGQCTFNESCR